MRRRLQLADGTRIDLWIKAFHETTEGLGILMKLSTTPSLSEARNLAARLGKISGAI